VPLGTAKIKSSPCDSIFAITVTLIDQMLRACDVVNDENQEVLSHLDQPLERHRHRDHHFRHLGHLSGLNFSRWTDTHPSPPFPALQDRDAINECCHFMYFPSASGSEMKKRTA
jgi:hypothetical protein